MTVELPGGRRNPAASFPRPAACRLQPSPAPRPLFTALVYAWTVALLSIHALISVLALPWMLVFDRDRRFAARLGSRLTRFGISLARDWRGASRGLASIRLDRPTIVVMNHRSLADIAVAVGVPGGPRIVSKPWVGRVPLVGWGLRLCGHVLFDPASARSIRAMMARMEGLLARGESVLFFPEGSRQTGAGLGPFRDGAFRLAVRTGVDVLPVVLHGTGELVPRGELVFRDVAVDVTPLPRIAPGKDRHALAREVHAAMAAALNQRGMPR